MTDFSKISSKYEQNSIVQKSASEILLALADIKDGEAILDLGCGTGHLTSQIKQQTYGPVVGVDPSPGMIGTAKKRSNREGISFRVLSADQLDYNRAFNLIFCNSAFQWFSDTKQVLARCYEALRPGGRIAIQAPAKTEYSPNFIKAVDAINDDSTTRDIFRNFRSPWFFLETSQAYRELFEQNGFTVAHSSIENVISLHSEDEVCKIFESGAAAGYLNQQYYSCRLPDDYAVAFRNIIRKAFHNQADQDGNVALAFNRIYLLAFKV